MSVVMRVVGAGRLLLYCTVGRGGLTHHTEHTHSLCLSHTSNTPHTWTSLTAGLTLTRGSPHHLTGTVCVPLTEFTLALSVRLSVTGLA